MVLIHPAYTPLNPKHKGRENLHDPRGIALARVDAGGEQDGGARMPPPPGSRGDWCCLQVMASMSTQLPAADRQSRRRSRSPTYRSSACVGPRTPLNPPFTVRAAAHL